MKEYQLLIVDADTTYAESLCSFFAKEPQFKVIAIKHTGLDALATIRTARPDIVLMNLILPLLDGLTVLKSVQQLLNAPLMICYSEFHSSIHLEAACKNGAHYFMYKPMEFHSLLTAMLECATIRHERKLYSSNQNDEESARLYRILHKLGFSSRHSGCTYLVEAVSLMSRSPMLQRNLKKGLYPEIARNLGSTPERVERSIRTAISFANASGKLSSLMNAAPTNKECLQLLLHMLHTSENIDPLNLVIEA